jgi:hypothetical protein
VNGAALEPRRTTAGLWVLRLIGAALLLAIAAIHVYLWREGYRDIPTIGPLFLLQSVIAVGGALLVLVAPLRLLPWAAILGALFAVGSLGALLLTTFVGMFDFQESTETEFWHTTVLVEIAAPVVLGILAAATLPRRR